MTADAIVKIGYAFQVDKSEVAIMALIHTVRIGSTGLEVELCCRTLSGRFDVLAPSAATIVLREEMRLTRTGRAVRFVHDNGRAATCPPPAASLIKLLRKARSWRAQLSEGETELMTIASREGISSIYVTRIIKLAFLSPPTVERILNGSQPAE